MKRSERNPAGADGGRRRRRSRSAAGAVTLVELMVAMGVLVLIVGVFNSLMVTCQRVVKVSQSTIKTNAGARAVISRIRTDLQGLTKEGFLAITYRGVDVDDPPCLIFTSVNSFQSLQEMNRYANAARVGFGATGGAADVLYRRAVLQVPDDASTVVTDDHEALFLAFYRANTQTPRTDIANILFQNVTIGGLTYQAVVTNPPAIDLPPTTLAQIKQLWPYMTSGAMNLRIQWTRPHPITGRLVWYDRQRPFDSSWYAVGRDAADQDSNPTLDRPEFQSDTGVYCALWTFKKKDNWPTALRIQMELGDPPRRYEVIVDLTR